MYNMTLDGLITSGLISARPADQTAPTGTSPCGAGAAWDAVCGCRPRSPVMADACEWKSSEYLKLMYNRGVREKFNPRGHIDFEYCNTYRCLLILLIPFLQFLCWFVWIQVELAKLGVSVDKAFDTFHHARAVIHNYHVCAPSSNPVGTSTIPIALEVFYGIVTAFTQAKYSNSANATAAELSDNGVSSITLLCASASSYPVDYALPDSLVITSTVALSSAVEVSGDPVRQVYSSRQGSQPRSKYPNSLPGVSRVAYDPAYDCTDGGTTASWTGREFHVTAVHADQHCCAAVRNRHQSSSVFLFDNLSYLLIG